MTTSAITTIEGSGDSLPLPRTTLLAPAGAVPGEEVGNRWRSHRRFMDRRPDGSTEILHSAGQCADTGAAAGVVESTDLEEYEALLAPWDITLEQIASGPFHCRSQYVKLPGIVAYEANWLRAMRTSGKAPDGLVMVGTSLARGGPGNHWCGHPVDRRRFCCAGPNAEFDHISPHESHHAVLLVERKLLAAAIGEDAVERICCRRHLEFSVADGERLIAAMTGVVRMANAYPELLADDRQVARARSRLLAPLTAWSTQAYSDERRGSLSRREASVRRAMDLVDRSLRPITALELAVACGVSQRTLEHGFRELLGVTPAAYLRVHRMNMAHHALAGADPRSNTVTEIALERGFSHPGRFSVEYRAMFGHSPSVTLKKTMSRPRSRLLLTDYLD